VQSSYLCVTRRNGPKERDQNRRRNNGRHECELEQFEEKLYLFGAE
jgi:hypothetical protein